MVIALAFILLAIIYIVREHGHSDESQRSAHRNDNAPKNVPRIFNGAKLLFNEKEISMSSPFKLHGRVDQAFITKDGLVIPVDTKERGRIAWYESDKLQLSVYALILSAMGYRVHTEGYIRIPNNQDPVWLKVPLGDVAYVGKYIDLYRKIKAGVLNPPCRCGKCAK